MLSGLETDTALLERRAQSCRVVDCKVWNQTTAAPLLNGLDLDSDKIA
ncbi:MAG: hypothetical protein QOE70_90 [Chthoniobacter sp.]|jgi:hypothetical protein|nr:hypothetical protein [Chthoniobacter sp.]